MGTQCPDWESGKPTAVVNTEHPNFALMGFGMIIFGFVLQLASLEKPKEGSPEKEKGKPQKSKRAN